MSENKYKCTNVKFNMENPEQAKGWNLLTSHKGKKSYADVISWALIKAYEQDESSNKLDTYQVPAISINAIDIAKQVVSQLKDENLIISAEVNSSSISSKDVPARDEQEHSGGDENINDKEELNAATTEAMLSFALG